jgi:hypothetical protein
LLLLFAISLSCNIVIIDVIQPFVINFLSGAPYSIYLPPCFLDCAFVSIPGSDAYYHLHWQDEYLAIARFTRPRVSHDGIYRHRHVLIEDDHFDLELGQQVHPVFPDAPLQGDSFLTAAAAAEVLVVTKALAASPPAVRALPALKPNHPNQSRPITPRQTKLVIRVERMFLRRTMPP